MTIEEGVAKTFKKAIKEKHKLIKHQTVKGKNEDRQIDENDILHNILNDNVMSVIVNLRLPCHDEAKPKIEPSNEPLHNDSHVIPKAEPINNDFEKLTLKTEPDDNDSYEWTHIETRTQRKRRNTTTIASSLDPSCPFKQEPSSNVATPRELQANNIAISNQSLHKVSREIEEIKSKREIRLNRKLKKGDIKTQNQRKDEIKQNRVTSEALTTQTGTVIATKKLSPLPRCSRKCGKIIPEAFRQKVYEHYWSLGIRKERRRFCSTLVDRIIRNPNDISKKKGNERLKKYAHKYCLKLETESYNICKACLLNTLGEQYDILQHPERLQKYKTDMRHTEKPQENPI